ncbi:MAG: Rpn family recombination-promoting nuclease/putative transposase [Planctomycetaceae bacterium]|jgi:hypothetical protein|nr:Rpn family recombination-promoting nuclease/putative transposase [Planctomycetaceae bacterium]
METNTEKTTKQKIDKQPHNPHDRFARKTLGNPVYASDFLKHYAGTVLTKYVNPDQLVAAPTHFLSNELHEVISDITFTARLRDKENGSDVLMFLEHKSKPSRFVPLQVGTHCFLSLYFGWTTAEYSETYNPPIPLMLLLYHGKEDINEEIFFQDIFSQIPKELRPYIPQFKIFIINLKRFRYDNLPGKPETQAIAESLKRATDGTFTSHLTGIFERIKAANLGKQQILDLIDNITRYCTWISNVTSEQIVQSITKTFNGTEGIDMATTIQKGIIQEGIEIGEVRGELKGKINTILDILRNKFGQVPQYIVDSLNQRTDLIALTSLTVHAVTCSSLDDFATDL